MRHSALLAVVVVQLLPPPSQLLPALTIAAAVSLGIVAATLAAFAVSKKNVPQAYLPALLPGLSRSWKNLGFSLPLVIRQGYNRQLTGNIKQCEKT